jgi:ABC-type transport system involved in multi-copper enzyme maturation permease subunit
MNWLIWKQHRRLFAMLATAIVLYAALAIPTGLHFWDTYQQALASCGKSNTCDQLSNELFQSAWESNLNPSGPSGAVNVVVLLVLAVPFLLGMFVGVPLITREYSDGTNLLVWTRSVSRRKWLTVKLVWVLLATAIFAVCFTVLTTWWSKSGNALYADRFDTLKFGMQNLAPVAYALFAVALGIALGAWLKRVLLAIGLTLAGLLVLQIVIGGFVRPHYNAPITVTASLTQSALSAKLPSGAWLISRRFVDQHGSVSSSPFDLPDWPPQCQALDQQQEQAPVAGGPKPPGPADIDNCLIAAGYRQIGTYQPSSRYWEFQWIEAGIYLAMAAMAICATYWLVLKRDA